MEEKPTLYLETSVISYYTAKDSNDPIVRGRQEVTRQWWNNHRGEFEIFITRFVLAEIQRGDPNAVLNRLDMIDGIESIKVGENVYDLADRLVQTGTALPAKARVDALHISAASIEGFDYLLTWNCTHIANAVLLPQVKKIVEAMGYVLPYICTPDQLLGV